MPTRRPLLVAAALFVLLSHGPYAQDQSVPTDLTPLLAAPQSEMRMVVQRYNLDRTTLSGNYANGSGRGGRGGRGGQRGGGAPAAAPVAAPPPPVPLSPARIARLKRFDTDWQAAVGKLDAAKLTPAAKTDLDGLKSTIAANLGAARRRGADDGAGDRRRAVRAEARPAGRSAHPRRGHERAARRRDDHRRHQGDRAADGRRRRG